MATEYDVRRAWHSLTGYEYKEGTDYDDNGDGTITPIPGSTLATDRAGGATTQYDRVKFSNSAPAGNLTMKVDASYSGVRKVSSPAQAYSAGTTINVHAESIHPIEAIEGNQGSVTFSAWCADSGAQALIKGNYICVRLGTVDLSGNVLGRSETYYKIIQRDAEQDSRGQRFYRYIAADLSEDIRSADVSTIPRTAQADSITYPGDTGGPPQQGVAGQRAYTLSMLLTDVVPAYATVVRNGPDFLLERLPEEGDGLELLISALKAGFYYMRWEGTRLVLEQHEPAAHNLSLALTDTQVYEVKTELGQQATPIESVRIERPNPSRRFRDTGMQQPDPALPPNGAGGSSIIPSEVQAFEGLAGDTVLYEVDQVWNPTQEFTDYEPRDLMFGFSDTAYNHSGYTGQQLRDLLMFLPQQATVQPPQRWTENQVSGPTGVDWCFLVRPNTLKVSQSNLDHVDGFVVSRNGYYSESGAINRNQNPIPSVQVLLTGLESGIILGPTITNSEGYFRVSTGGNRDKWIVSAYHPSDAYQANKLDAFTTGHPYDDDPNNDGLGPDNRVAQEDQWQLLQTIIKFQLIYKTNRELPDGPEDATGELAGLYRGAGGFYFGDADAIASQILDDASLDVDTANITTDVQAGLLSEKIIDRSAEEQDVYVVTKPFGGEMTAPGRCLAIRIAADGGISADVRIMTREIQVETTGIVEVLSTAADFFANETDRRFAKRRSTETLARQIGKRIESIQQQLMNQAGLLEEVYGSGVK